MTPMFGILEIVIVGGVAVLVLSALFGRRRGGHGGSLPLKIVGTMAIVGGIALFWSRSSDEMRTHQVVAEPGAAMHLEPGEFAEVSRRLERGFWHGPVRHTTHNRSWMFVLMGTVLIIGGALLFGRDRTRPVAFKVFTVLGISAVLYIMVAFFGTWSQRAAPGRDTVVRLEPVNAVRPVPPEKMVGPRGPKHAKRPKSRPHRPVVERVSEELPPRAGEIPVAAELADDQTRAAAAPQAAPATPAPEPAAAPIASAPETATAAPPVATPPAPDAPADVPPPAAEPAPPSATAAAEPASAQPPAAEAAPTPSAPASALAPAAPSASPANPVESPAAAPPAPPSEPAPVAAPSEPKPAAPAAPAKTVEVQVAEPKIEVPLEVPRPLSRAVESTPRPEWLDAPPRLVSSVYIVPVRSGLFASLPECQGQLNMQIKREADHYIDELLRDLGEHASAIVDISPEYLQRHVKKAEYSELRVSDSVGPMHQVHALLEFDEEARSMFRRRWHDAVVTDRLWFTGAGAALVLALLGTFYGYLKLDTQTGGAHKGKLQLAATLAALIAATAALMVRHSVLF